MMGSNNPGGAGGGGGGGMAPGTGAGGSDGRHDDEAVLTDFLSSLMDYNPTVRRRRRRLP
uniref:Uncharacterized protein n=1 Tax=Triticum urartu TaxID=4572 RepID=A0A8R7QZ04_TRIUA